MSNTVIRAYDADVRYTYFTGLNQYGTDRDMDSRYSDDAYNVDTVGGVLQPFAKNVHCGESSFDLPDKIETLMHLYRRWPNTNGEIHNVLVAASAGKLYWADPRTFDEWHIVTVNGESEYTFTSSVWSAVSYEINEADSEYPEDVLLISNAYDGMYMIRGNTFNAVPVSTEHKYGIIERYAERIWGGAILDEPDMLEYSRAYDPTNWSGAFLDEDLDTNGEPMITEEDLAGQIMQPSWDGDSFTAMRAFGDQLIAFKRLRVWRVYGTNPGEYTFKEQYGGGAPYANTVAVDAERIYMLTADGVCVYDGNTVSPFQHVYAQSVWRMMNRSALDQSTACFFQKRYFVAVPINGSDVNNALVIYNTQDGSWLLRKDIYIESFLVTEAKLFYTTSKAPGAVYEYVIDAWQAKTSDSGISRWVTPWQDFGYRNMQKGPFKIYIDVEVGDHPVDFDITIETEKGKRTKEVRAHPLLKVEERFGQYEKTIRVNFPGNSCKRFRVILETHKGSPVWRIPNGFICTADIAYDG